MKHYLYKGVEYKSEREVRNAIFKHERKAFGVVGTNDGWGEFDVVVKDIQTVVTEEQLARDIRYKRDTLLSKSDYYVMSDYPSTEEGLTEVKQYRQYLRDITKQEGFPFEIIWPVKPKVL